MTYYPQSAPSYASPPQDIAYGPGHAPPYAPAYSPPMRQNRASNGGTREQLPGEEWVRGSDGSFYPANQNNQYAPSRPPQPRRRPYWE